MKIEDIMNLSEKQLLELIPELQPLITCPVVHPAHQYSVYVHTIKSMEFVDEPFLKFVVLFHDIGKPNVMFYDEKGHTRFFNHEKMSVEITKPILERLHIDKKIVPLILTLIEYHDSSFDTKEKMQTFIDKYGLKTAELLLQIQRADLMTHTDEYITKRIPVLEKENLLLNQLKK